jgi:hypothetical protein
LKFHRSRAIGDGRNPSWVNLQSLHFSLSLFSGSVGRREKGISSSALSPFLSPFFFWCMAASGLSRSPSATAAGLADMEMQAAAEKVCFTEVFFR